MDNTNKTSSEKNRIAFLINTQSGNSVFSPSYRMTEDVYNELVKLQEDGIKEPKLIEHLNGNAEIIPLT